MVLKCKNKNLVVMVLCLALIMITAGCKNKKAGRAQAQAEKSFVPALATDTKASVKVVGNYKNFEAIEAEFDRFNQIYPNVELSFSFLDNYNSVVLSSLYSEEAPDIFFLFSWMVGMPKYEPLFEIAEDLSDPKYNINLDCIYEGNSITTSDGKKPMLPMFSQGFGMLVNEDLFKKEKLSVPQNFDELIDVWCMGIVCGIMGIIMIGDITLDRVITAIENKRAKENSSISNEQDIAELSKKAKLEKIINNTYTFQR